ncbi:MAG: hypothetical protein M5U09_19860 [Gammaproteobacteria bacterium]|nr:hypothetical protein [Gammaproteobacteria bacterium]
MLFDPERLTRAAALLLALGVSAAFASGMAVAGDGPEVGDIAVPLTDSGSSPEPGLLHQPSALDAQLFQHGDPSAIEQLMIELINRARSDPGAEAARFEIDLNDDLDPGTIADTPETTAGLSSSLDRRGARPQPVDAGYRYFQPYRRRWKYARGTHGGCGLPVHR